jgi:hypothetical protein
VVGIRLKVQDANTARVQLFSDLAAAGGQNGFRNFDFPLTELSAHHFAIDFDFDNDTVEYFVDGAPTDTFNDFSATQLGSLQFITNSWSAASTVTINEIGLSVIPEPASLILMTLGGTAFLRRNR